MILSFRINECAGLSSIRGVMPVWDYRVANQALHVRIAFKGCSHGLDERTTDYGIAFIRDFMVFSQSQRILGLRGRLTRIDCNVGSRAGL